MKGKLDSQGYLHLYRVSGYEPAKCPFVVIGVASRCCTHACALMGEPVFINHAWMLPLCHKALVFKEFIDERQVPVGEEEPTIEDPTDDEDFDKEEE